MNFIDADLHIHSKYSYDSLLEPKDIIKIAVRRGLSLIAITDHNTLAGSLLAIQEVSELTDQFQIMVIPGVEISTNFGDLIALFVEEEIKSRILEEVVENVRKQDGMIILPHPYRGHKNLKTLLRYTDLIEVVNDRSSLKENKRAIRLTKLTRKPFTAGSDAHFSFEVGRVRLRIYYYMPSDAEEIRKLLRSGFRDCIGKPLPIPLIARVTSSLVALSRKRIGIKRETYEI